MAFSGCAPCNGGACHINRQRLSYLPIDVVDQSKGKCTFPNPYIVPQLRVVNPKLSLFCKTDTCPGPGILKFHDLGNPLFIFGQPFSGKTCLFMKLLTAANETYGPNHWIRLVDMKEVVQTLKKLDKKPKDFLELLSIQLKISLPGLKELFSPLPDARALVAERKYDQLITGELFLDGFDEIPLQDQEYFLKLLPQMRSQRIDCPIRIWISSRTYQKTTWMKATGDSSPAAFEMLGCGTRQQMDILFFRWKHHYDALTKDENDKLWKFAQTVYALLRQQINNFETTIGAIPMFMSIIAGVLLNHAVAVVENLSSFQFTSCAGICTGEVLDSLARNVVEFHCLKLNKPTDEGFIQRECQRIARLYCKFAIETFPFYECQHSTSGTKPTILMGPPKPESPKSMSTFVVASTKPVCRGRQRNGDNRSIHIPDELYRVGLIQKPHDGLSAFTHKMLGDFFIGRYFAYPNSLDVRDLTFDSFFLRVFLFDAEAKPARGFFDAFLYFVREYQPRILHDFIMKHYRLSKSKKSEWKRIKDYGNIWHMLVMEGHHRTAQIIIDAFCIVTEMEEMRQFLRMRVPIRIYEGIYDKSQLPDSPQQPPMQEHIVSSLGILALFGYSFIVNDTLKLFLTIYDLDEIRKHFNRQGTWTPVHYAAMHSNLWFILQVYGTDFYKKVGIKSGLYNPMGQHSLHLLMSYSWSHVMIIRDLFYPDLDRIVDNDPEPSTPEKGKCKGKKAGGRSGNGKRLNNKDSRTAPSAVSNAQQNVATKPQEERIPNDRYVFIYRDMHKELGDAEYNLLIPCLFACMEKLVVNAGEDVNVVEKSGHMTILHIAAQDGLLETLRFLLKLNADVAATDAYGKTPLHYAGLHGHRQIFMTLVKNGAKAIQRDKDGKSAIMLWKEYGEEIDESDEYQTPMTIAELHFFNACYDIDKLMTDISSKHERLKADELRRREEELEEDLRNMSIDDGEEGAYDEESEAEIDCGAETPIDVDQYDEEVQNGDEADDENGYKSESDIEQPSNEYAHTTSPDDDEAENIDDESVSDQDDTQVKEEEIVENKQPNVRKRSRKYKVKVIRKECSRINGVVEGFEEIEIKETREEEDSDDGREQGGIQTSYGTMKLEFVDDNNEPLVPTAAVYNEVVSHLSTLLEFQGIKCD